MREETSKRKAHHIDLAFESQVKGTDRRFNYEPLVSGHPGDLDTTVNFLRKNMRFPLWISSMTGGTEKAGFINHNLAKAAHKYGLGMGLGSCRIILDDHTYLPDFQLRNDLGDQPFYANLGIAQLEELLEANQSSKIKQLIEKTETDGLIIHVNPMQEWLQPEGDRFKQAPLQTIQQVRDLFDGKIIVKEVGQGMGPKSLKALMEMDVDAIDFGAHGGTNFAMLELLRDDEEMMAQFENLTYVGHDATEMVDLCNDLMDTESSNPMIIVSGGVSSFLDGYYYINKLKTPAVYGQASALLKRAAVSFELLDDYISREIEGYKLASSYLTIKNA